MVMGARIVNPIHKHSNGDVSLFKKVLIKTIFIECGYVQKKQTIFVLDMHSLIKEVFSSEKTETVLKMAKELLKNLHDSE